MRYSAHILFLIVVFIVACTEKPATKQTEESTEEYHFQQFSKEALQQDLTYLFNQLDSVHFNLYHKHSKEEFQATYYQLKGSMKDSMNLFEFYYHALPLYDMLEDAHSMLVFPFDYTKEFESQGGKFIPFEVDIEKEHVYISKNYSKAQIDPYSEILSINGVSIKEILGRLDLLINNERKTSEEKYMARFFDRVLYPLYGFDKKYSVTIQTPEGESKTYDVAGVPSGIFQIEWLPHFDYYTIGDSIGVIDINLCEDKELFASFCDSVFTTLASNSIANLVIDVRDNGGGSTFHGDTLFTYITDKPFTQYGPVEMKLSPMVNSDLDSIYVERYEGLEPRTTTNTKRFNGDVYMLANENTFSSAAMMAATFKCYGMGTLVGRETGGVQVFFDEPIVMVLPNTGLRFLASYQYRWCACGEQTDRGVQPDVSTTWNVQDNINGVDTEMEKVLELIQGR